MTSVWQSLRSSVRDPLLTPNVLALWEQFLALVVEKNEVMNLTRIESPSDAILKHFLDSWAVFEMLREQGLESSVKTYLDFGCGAGFPSIPIHLACPHFSGILVDARQKKLDFVKEAASRLGLKNIRYIHENWSLKSAKRFGLGQKIDLGMATAVSDTKTLLDLLIACGCQTILLTRGPNLLPDEWEQACLEARNRGYMRQVKLLRQISFQEQIITRNLFLWSKL